jgi:hypothetical protein
MLKLRTPIGVFRVGRNLTEGFLDCQEKGCTHRRSGVNFLRNFPIFMIKNHNVSFTRLPEPPVDNSRAAVLRAPSISKKYGYSNFCYKISLDSKQHHASGIGFGTVFYPIFPHQ